MSCACSLSAPATAAVEPVGQGRVFLTGFEVALHLGEPSRLLQMLGSLLVARAPHGERVRAPLGLKLAIVGADGAGSRACPSTSPHRGVSPCRFERIHREAHVLHVRELLVGPLGARAVCSKKPSGMPPRRDSGPMWSAAGRRPPTLVAVERAAPGEHRRARELRVGDLVIEAPLHVQEIAGKDARPPNHHSSPPKIMCVPGMLMTMADRAVTSQQIVNDCGATMRPNLVCAANTSS